MLARIRKAQENNEGGFTLIELLVVMIIIGILAAIAIPAFLSQKKKGYEASEKSDLRSIVTEITTAQVDNPDTIALSQAGGASTPVLVTPTTGGVAGTAGSINVSPGNVLGANSAVAADGTFCVSLTNPKAGDNWKITGGPGATQALAKGAC